MCLTDVFGWQFFFSGKRYVCFFLFFLKKKEKTQEVSSSSCKYDLLSDENKIIGHGICAIRDKNGNEL